MGVPSLNDLAVDGTLNTTNQPTIKNSIYERFINHYLLCEIRARLIICFILISHLSNLSIYHIYKRIHAHTHAHTHIYIPLKNIAMIIYFLIAKYFCSVIGTSSLRRIAQLKRNFPHLEFLDVVSFYTSFQKNLVMYSLIEFYCSLFIKIIS